MLAETFHDLEEEKEQIALDIKRRKDRIENLVPMIRNILNVFWFCGETFIMVVECLFILIFF